MPPVVQNASQKKQKSIASFFTAKPALNPKPKPSGQAASPSTSSRTPVQTIEDHEVVSSGDRKTAQTLDLSQFAVPKRSVSELDPDEDDDGPLVRKRRKPSGDAPRVEILDEQSASSHEEVAPIVRKQANATDRTSKYIFAPCNGGQGPAAAPEEDEDESVRRTKQKLHQKFVKKLGGSASLAVLKHKSSVAEDELDGEHPAEDEDEEEDEEEESERPGKYRAGPRRPARKSAGKLTPLQKEILELKRKYPDTLLIIEVGYKFQIYGEDARKAAKELSIVCIPGKFKLDEPFDENKSVRFASASFPTHRLQVHAKRLVLAGHKVGIVRQLETAALKAVGSTKNKLFQRGLTNLYTKGTFSIDDEESLEGESTAIGASVPATGFLLCLTESYPKGQGSDEKVRIGLIAVQPSTGDIIYDDFEDSWMRSELETRLLHISPCEFLIVGEISTATKKLIDHLCGGGDARIEMIDKPKTMAAQAYSHITKFYADKIQDDGGSATEVSSSVGTGALLDKVHKLSENATICLSAMITHLTEYKVQHVFDLTKYFQSFSSRSHMLLNGNTLASLEIYRNQNDYTEYGSLFWIMNRTQTRFGQRMLRNWIGRPLLDRARLDERVAAVEELVDVENASHRERISSLLAKTKADLERSLVRIYYKRCARPELLAFLQTLLSIGQEYAGVATAADIGFSSPNISEAILSLPCILDDVVQYLERINAEAAKSNDKYGFFRPEFATPDMKVHEAGIVAVEHDLDEFRAVAAQKLQLKRPVEYATVAQIDFLIEVDNTQLKKVPASWSKISGTKKLSRYHAPEVVKWIRERDQHKEALSNACDAAFVDLLSEIALQYQSFRDCIQSLALLDCLLSLAKVAEQPGYCKPKFTTSPEASICITQGRHPMVEGILDSAFVPNDVDLHSEKNRALLITGPNMGGKSSYVRSVALISIMAQIGSYVPAEAVELGLLDAVFTRMGAGDNLMKGESTFMVEVGETSDILKQATPRSLVILDELGRGTSTHDGVAIAQAVLEHFVAEKKCLTLFITHYQTLARMQDSFPGGELRNVHMSFTEEDDNVTFLYEVADGVAHRSYGLNVARMVGLPESLLAEASKRSQMMEKEERRRRVGYLAGTTQDLSRGAGDGFGCLQKLIQGIEEL
jgi:DNA mismatch repair protein MSH3